MKRAAFFKQSLGAIVATVVGSKLDFISEVPKGEGVMVQLKKEHKPRMFRTQCDGYTVTFVHNELYDGPIENYSENYEEIFQ